VFHFDSLVEHHPSAAGQRSLSKKATCKGYAGRKGIHPILWSIPSISAESVYFSCASLEGESMCDTCSVSAAQNSALQTQIQVSVLMKQQSAVKQQGAAAVALIESAAQVGKSIDTGKAFDAVA